MISEFDALSAAKLLIEKHGEQEAWRILTGRAINEHITGRVGDRTITQQVLSALHKLTKCPEQPRPTLNRFSDGGDRE